MTDILYKHGSDNLEQTNEKRRSSRLINQLNYTTGSLSKPGTRDRVPGTEQKALIVVEISDLTNIFIKAESKK